MSDPVSAQYEALPYPARDPADEVRRLVTGSPSHPLEIDHYLYAGHRDWAQPFRVLVAGGGTGDALIMLAEILRQWGCPAEIHYLDLSEASRKVAEARAAARGLTSITFHTGDLLSAPDHGPFDYIDCCGVLHHLPDPDAGFAALAQALSPGGGLGAMVYAPYGRTGVYEMQAALRALIPEDAMPAEQVAQAKRLLTHLPPTNRLTRNPYLGDHVGGGDAGLFDLLLHSRDRAYTVPELDDALTRAGLSLVSFAMPAQYDPRLLIADPELRARAAALPFCDRAALAERIAGNLKTHAFYATLGSPEGRIASPSPDAVPNLREVAPEALARSVAEAGRVRVDVDGLQLQRGLPKDAAQIIAEIDGVRSLGEIAKDLGLDWATFEPRFATLYMPLNNFNLLRFSCGPKGAHQTR